jgi:hypothetical protein
VTINEKSPIESLEMIRTKEEEPWYVDFVKYLATGIMVKGWTHQQRQKFFFDVEHYLLEDPYMFKICANQVIRRCAHGKEAISILRHCHEGPTGGHNGASYTAKIVFHSGFYWPTIYKDAYTLIKSCNVCQRVGNMSSRNDMP